MDEQLRAGVIVAALRKMKELINHDGQSDVENAKIQVCINAISLLAFTPEPAEWS